MRSLLLVASMVLVGASTLVAAPPPAARDALFAPIPSWTQTSSAGGVTLAYQSNRSSYNLAVRATRPRQGAPIAQWKQLWTDELASAQLRTSIAPGPHRARLSSGYAVYWDGGKMQTIQGVDVVAVVYLVVGADRVLPIVGFFRSKANDDNTLDYDLEESLEPWFSTIRLTGGPATEPLYETTDLIGTWTTGSAATETLELRAGGRYVSTYRGAALGTAFTDTSTGTWSIDDTALVVHARATQEARRIWSIGGAPSGASSIRIAPSYASQTNAPLANPRSSDRAGWFVRTSQ